MANDNERPTSELMALAMSTAGAKAVLQVVQPLGGATAIASMAVALTATIEQAFPPAQRLDVLNRLLAETIGEWALAAARGPETVQ